MWRKNLIPWPKSASKPSHSFTRQGRQDRHPRPTATTCICRGDRSSSSFDTTCCTSRCAHLNLQIMACNPGTSKPGAPEPSTSTDPRTGAIVVVVVVVVDAVQRARLVFVAVAATAGVPGDGTVTTYWTRRMGEQPSIDACDVESVMTPWEQPHLFTGNELTKTHHAFTAIQVEVMGGDWGSVSYNR